jgi:LysR family glycine cleavage system transcriptional activator
MEGMGVALGRLTMARPLIESGRLVALTGNRLLDRYAHYLVYPPRSENHPAVIAFRTWILDVAASESPAPRSEPPDMAGPQPLPRRRGRKR